VWAPGSSGFFINQANFSPTAAGKGGSIRACLQRGVSGGTTGFAPFIFIGLQGVNTSDTGYILGISDGNPGHVVLRKGTLNAGVGAVPDSNPGTDGVLRKSTGTKATGVWAHLRLDMIVNTNGDVVLNVYENDLAAHPLGTPEDWQPITGMTSFVDDALGVNTGSFPYTTGRMGFGFWVANLASRRGFVEAVSAMRQL
jgi:hypothetical protein